MKDQESYPNKNKNLASEEGKEEEPSSEPGFFQETWEAADLIREFLNPGQVRKRPIEPEKEIRPRVQKIPESASLPVDRFQSTRLAFRKLKMIVQNSRKKR